MARFAYAARKVWQSNAGAAEKREAPNDPREAVDHDADRVEESRLTVKTERTW